MGTVVIAFVFVAMGAVLLAVTPSLDRRPGTVPAPGSTRPGYRRGPVEVQSVTLTRVRYADGTDASWAGYADTSPYSGLVDTRC